MASIDLRLNIGFLRNPKAIKLQRAHGSDGIVCLLRLWCWAREHRPHGNLDGMDNEEVCIAAGWSGGEEFVGTLKTIGFLDETDSGLQIHEWLDHQPFVLQQEKAIEYGRLGAIAKKMKRSADPLQGTLEAPLPGTLQAESNRIVLREEYVNSSESTTEPPSRDKTPYKEIINLYHSICTDLPQVKALTSTRKTAIKLRHNNEMKKDPSQWKMYFQKIHSSNFLSRNEKSNFCNLDWILKPGNMVKVIEGNYDNKDGKVVSQGGVDLKAKANECQYNYYQQKKQCPGGGKPECSVCGKARR